MIPIALDGTALKNARTQGRGGKGTVVKVEIRRRGYEQLLPLDVTRDEVQILTVTATSSQPALIPNPTVNYSSPSATGSLAFSPLPNASGTATITITANAIRKRVVPV